VYGQLGTGTSERVGVDGGEMGDYLPAIDIGSNRFVSQVSCGRLFTCVILEGDNGDVKCFGRADFGLTLCF